MPSRRSRQDVYGGSNGMPPPPEYNSAIRFDGGMDPQQEDYYYEQPSNSRGMPYNAFDSSRAVANDATANVGGGNHSAYSQGYGDQYEEMDEEVRAGGRNRAHMTPDTPSMYTDPYEYASTVAGPTKRGGGAANVMATRPDQNFLQQDPYPSSRDHLRRSDTLGTLAPGDSISAYNLDARSRNMMERDDGDLVEHGRYQTRSGDEYYHHRPNSMSQDYYTNNISGAGQFDRSSASLALKDHAAHMGYADDEHDEKRQRDAYWNDGSEMKMQDWNSDHHPPALFANNMQGAPILRKSGEEGEDVRRGLLGKLTSKGQGNTTKPGWGGSLEEQIRRRRNGVGRQRWPILSWLLSIAYVVVFIIELIKAKSVTGQAIQTKPSINPMIGPPFEFLINFGARFVPCMRNVPAVPLTTQMICLKDSAQSSVAASQTCPLYQICGLPNASTFGQSYRFVTPIFIHAGFVHIGFNLLAQLTLGSQIEKIFSTPIFAVVFAAGGIGGNLLGGNFGLVGLPSVGASGAIYACISMELTDLLYNWQYEHRPRVRLIASIIFTIIGFAIGLLPGLDNFAHIGGFAVGILGGAMLGPSIHESRRHRIITWIVRVIAAGLLVGFFVGLATNFYNSDDPSKACTWCRYLSCLPVFSQCKGNGLTVTTTSSGN